MKKEISFLSLVGLICLVQSCTASPTSDKLTFNPAKYQKQEFKYEGKTIKVRAYEKIVYVANPVDVNYEIMNIYIPEEYFNGNFRTTNFSEESIKKNAQFKMILLE